MGKLHKEFFLNVMSSVSVTVVLEVKMRLFVFVLICTLKWSNSVQIDPLGYMVYCPCMGRFGNQADQFLGALAFAHNLNRTLVLPPWVEYRYGEPKSIQVPFNTYFRVEPLQTYHKVILMEEFMRDIAPIEWPREKRIAFCYTNRAGTSEIGCNAKEGNPFGPFWDTFDIDFVHSEFYAPLMYDKESVKEWREKYHPVEWPVLAFTGAPATFPVQGENRILHKYLQWSSQIEERAAKFIRINLPVGAFIALHLRNGNDWVRACEHIEHSPNLFAAPQCLGYFNEFGRATHEMCLPNQETIIDQLIESINAFTLVKNPIKSVFAASDNNHMVENLNEALKPMDIQIFRYEQTEPHIDLAIMARANLFIGNCVSSFSAFVKRERDVHGLPTAFWAFNNSKTNKNRDEL